MPAKLLLQSNDGKVQEIPFDRERITIGRKAGNDLHFNRPEISGTHAEFLLENDQFFVTDLGSTNGTMMNGAKLLPNQKYALQDGDLILIAPFRIQFVAEKDMFDTVTEDQAQDTRAGSGTMIDINAGKVSTGTEEHKARISTGTEEQQLRSKEPPAQADAAKAPGAPAAPAPAPKEEAKPAVPPPPPPRQAAEPASPPEPEEELPLLEVPSKGGDFLWLGLGAIFLLLAIGLIVFLLMQ